VGLVGFGDVEDKNFNNNFSTLSCSLAMVVFLFEQ